MRSAAPTILLANAVPTVEVSSSSPTVDAYSPSSVPSERQPLRELHDAIASLDAEYFARARGNFVLARQQVENMSPEKMKEAMLIMYQMLYVQLDAVERHFVNPILLSGEGDGFSRHSSNLSVARGGSEQVPSSALALQNSAVVNSHSEMASRTMSMVSLGAQSIQSLIGRGNVQKTNFLHKSLDDESGNKKLNEYLILGDLGKGSQAKVKLAFDTIRNQLRALKVIRRPRVVAGRGAADVAARLRVEHEINITKKLRHKNLVALYEVIDDPAMNKLYLVLQYIGKGPITEVHGVFCQRFEEARCAHFARQLCAGLTYLHQHGVVHRDIKPANILIGEDDDVYFVDFGVSDLLNDPSNNEGEDDTDDGDQWTSRRQQWRKMDQNVVGGRGTPAFLAPEILKPDTPPQSNLLSSSSSALMPAPTPAMHNGCALDIWALGVTLFMILCGRLPWIFIDETTADDDPSMFRFNMQQYFQMVSTVDPMFPPYAPLREKEEFTRRHFNFVELATPLSKPWTDLLKDMLNRDPAKRPTIQSVRRRVKSMKVPGSTPPIGVSFRSASPQSPSQPQTHDEQSRDRSPSPTDVPIPKATVSYSPQASPLSGGGGGSGFRRSSRQVAVSEESTMPVPTPPRAKAAQVVSPVHPRRATRQWKEE